MSASFLAHKPIQKSIAIKCQMEFEGKNLPPFWPVRFSFFQSSEKKPTDSGVELSTFPCHQKNVMRRRRDTHHDHALFQLRSRWCVFPLFELRSELWIDRQKNGKDWWKTKTKAPCQVSPHHPKAFLYSSRVLSSFFRVRSFFLPTRGQKLNWGTDAPNVLTLEISLDLFS